MSENTQANAIGRSSKTVREFLEKAWKADMTQDESIKLAVKSLLEVVQTGAKNIDLAVMEGFGQVRVSSPLSPSLELENATDWVGRTQNLTLEEITKVVAEIEKEKEAEAEKKKNRLAATAASREAMLTGSGVDAPVV